MGINGGSMLEKIDEGNNLVQPYSSMQLGGVKPEYLWGKLPLTF
jgi:hypothetical protein